MQGPSTSFGAPPGVAVTTEREECPPPFSAHLEHFPRLTGLRRALLDAQPAVCIERARLATEYLQRAGFDEARPVLRQARVLSHVLEQLPVVIFDDELIVGSTTAHRLGTLLYPELMGMAIWPELTRLSRRAHDPVQLSEDAADLLAEQIFPFWRDHTVAERARRSASNSESLDLGEQFAFYMLSKINGISHVIPAYSRVVEEGLAALAQDASERERAARLRGDDEAVEYQTSVSVVLTAVIRFAERYAAACEHAAEEATGERARELNAAANVLHRVPRLPARSFHEALQAIWITQVALHQENNDMALSFGRLDQILAPFYDADLQAGRLHLAGAAELLGCFFLKLGDHTPLVPAAAHDFFGGTATNQAVTLGGLRADGTDGTCELSHLMLDVSAMLSLREPNLCARVHAQTSPAFFQAIAESIYRSGAAPAVYGDEPIVDALTKHGVSLEDARDYGVIGCVETTSVGRTMGMTGAILLNLAGVLELALFDGMFPLSGQRVGPARGKLADFEHFDQLWHAFEAQLRHVVALAVEGNRVLAEAHACLRPTPLLSALIRGTAESERDVTHGGARYNSSGVAIIGLADVADSLTALRDLVFERQKLSAREVEEALSADFVGHDRARAILRRKPPRYGMDDPRADSTVQDLVRLLSRVFDEHSAPRGGRYHLGYWSITMHAGLGTVTGALPNGRRRGEAIASGATPVSGAARKGPTASLASTARLPAECIANGIANNHKLPRSLLRDPEKRRLLARLLEVYFQRGGLQVQFTVQDRLALLAAQENPEAYRDLLVRVSGYTAYFCDLNRKMQDEIIARTEDQL